MDHLPRVNFTLHFLILAAAIIVRAILTWARQVSGFNAGAAVRQEVRQTLATHIMSLGPVRTGAHPSGALAVAAMEQVEALQDFFSLYLPQLLLVAMVPATILAVVFPFSWAAASLLLFTAPLIPLFMVLVGMGAESVSQRHFQALSRLSGHFLDILHGLPTLKIFGRSRAETGNIEKTSREYRQRTMGVLRIAFLSSAVLEFFSAMAIALVAVYLGLRFLGYIEFGSYGLPLTLSAGLFILLLAPDFYQPFRDLGAYYHARAHAAGAAEEIMNILSMEKPSGESTASKPAPDRFSLITLRRIDLGFDNGNRPVFNGLNLDIRRNEHVALVGESGGGKTTLLHLLLKFVYPQNGVVLLDDMNLNHIDADSWRRDLGWMSQSPFLFHGTIRENIQLADPSATDRQIETAARQAHVMDFCDRWQHGLDTHMAERGVGLSRGQAQRVALARVFLKNAPILLLDEPTAALDNDTAALILGALKQFAKDRTMIMVSHRLSKITAIDRVLVLAEGRVAEEGSFEQLMAVNGRFHRLYHRQQELERL